MGDWDERWRSATATGGSSRGPGRPGRQTIEETQNAPRWVIREFGPFSEAHLLVEPGIAATTITDLRRRGHLIEQVGERQPGWGPVSMIHIDGDTRSTHLDPRVDTTSAVVF